MKHAGDDGKGGGKGASLLSLSSHRPLRASYSLPQVPAPRAAPNKASAEERDYFIKRHNDH